MVREQDKDIKLKNKILYQLFTTKEYEKIKAKSKYDEDN